MNIVISRVVIIAMLALGPSSAIAQETSDDWQFSATVYGWFPDIGGQTSFPLDSGSTIDIDIGTILDNLKMTAQGSFELHKGNWGALTDLVYLNVGAANSQTRNVEIGGQPLPSGVTAATDFDLKSTILTLGGTYRLADNPGLTSDLLFGARLASFDQTLDWELDGNFGPVTPPQRTGSREASVDQWDAIIGTKGRLALGVEQNWAVPFHFDIGAGDSDLTWQAMVGLVYAFDWGDLGAAWRYLDYDLKSGGPIENLNFNGPALGATFRW